MKYKILVVDDEAFNLDIMCEYLEDEGYEVIQAKDGAIAMECLKKHTDTDLIVLDRMMPNMDGIAVVNKLKQSKKLKSIPVVMQTAAAQKEQVLEGIKSGVYYYLTKPYDKEIFLGIVSSAIEVSIDKKKAEKEAAQGKSAIGLLDTASFKIHSLNDAHNLAYFISHCLPNTAQVAYALKELLVNAIEHGNLGISYEEKTNLVLQGKWSEEIEKRLELPEYKDMHVSIEYTLNNNLVEIVITDQGKGFNWDKYLDISADRAMDPNGRGIATAVLGNSLKIEYKGKGNIVVCSALVN